MKKSLLAIFTSAVTLISGSLLPVFNAQAESTSPLVTCVNILTKAERISHTGKCRVTHEAQANWHLLNSDSTLPAKGKSKTLIICSNKPTSTVSYKIIRARCAKHQVKTEFYRSTLLHAAPTIAKVVATGHDTAQVSLTKEVATNADAPVAFYTITSSKGQSKNVYTWGELNLTIDNLSELTTYSFTVTATSADGTSSVSMPSDSVTTAKYVAPPAAASASAPVAQVSLLSSDTAAVTIPAGATSVAVSAPTLGNPSLSFGSQSAAISATISTAANPAGGSSTPFTVSGSTKIVDIVVTGLSGSATVCLDASPTAKLWHYENGAWVDITTSHTATQVCGITSSFSPFTGEETLPAPAFTLSVSSRTGNQDSAISSVTATKTAHTQTVTYSVSPALPAGLSINSSTGTISGTPSVTSSATNYVITATNAAAGTATQTITITVDAALTCAQGGACSIGAVGPGGGTIFYVSAGGFNCGASFSSTGSPTGGLCHYLEVAPKTWYGGSSDPTIKFSNYTSWSSGVNPVGIESEWDLGATVPGEIGRGFKNTELLFTITSRSNFPAADATRAYSGGSLNDWYMPSLVEINQLCKWSYGKSWVSDSTKCNPSGSVLNYADLSLAAATNAPYQISTLAPNARQKTFKMKTVESGTEYATQVVSVRPIRAF